MKIAIDIEVLRKLEWIRNEFTGVTGGQCLICGGYKKGTIMNMNILYPGEFEGHADDCELGKAIDSANMAKVYMTIELTYDKEYMHGNDKESLDWFFDTVLFKGALKLYSDEVGDFIGNVKTIQIKDLLCKIQIE